MAALTKSALFSAMIVDNCFMLFRQYVRGRGSVELNHIALKTNVVTSNAAGGVYCQCRSCVVGGASRNVLLALSPQRPKTQTPNFGALKQEPQI